MVIKSSGFTVTRKGQKIELDEKIDNYETVEKNETVDNSETSDKNETVDQKTKT